MEKQTFGWITDFKILKTKVIDGVMFAYIKDSNGFYGWYKLDVVEMPDDEQ